MAEIPVFWVVQIGLCVCEDTFENPVRVWVVFFFGFGIVKDGVKAFIPVFGRDFYVPACAAVEPVVVFRAAGQFDGEGFFESGDFFDDAGGVGFIVLHKKPLFVCFLLFYFSM